MKTHFITRYVPGVAGLFYTSSLLAHTGGDHSGGLLQQLIHIVQSADHLFIPLALGAVVSLIIHHLNKKHH